MADGIWLLFGVVSRTGPGMRHVMGLGDRSVGKGNVRGKYWVPQCYQWGLFTIQNSHYAAARLLHADFLELLARQAGKACRRLWHPSQRPIKLQLVL